MTMVSGIHCPQGVGARAMQVEEGVGTPMNTEIGGAYGIGHVCTFGVSQRRALVTGLGTCVPSFLMQYF